MTDWFIMFSLTNALFTEFPAVPMEQIAHVERAIDKWVAGAYRMYRTKSQFVKRHPHNPRPCRPHG